MADGFFKDPHKQFLADKLRVLLCIESSRPYQIMNYRLVHECSDLLAELEGQEKLSKKVIKKQVSAVVNKCLNRKYRSKGKIKTMLIAACIAILILISGIFVLSMKTGSYDALKHFGHQLIEMFGDDSFDAGNVTIIKNEDVKIYYDIKSFSSENNAQILYPSVLPNNAKIDEIHYFMYLNNYNVVFKFDNSKFSFEVVLDNIDKNLFNIPNILEKNINKVTCYIYSLENSVQCFFFDNGNTYFISAPTLEDLHFLVENLKES